jgi:hypothetical protein
MSKHLTPIVPLDGQSSYYDGATKRKFNPAMKCPAAPPDFNEKIHYANHGVAMPHMPLEWRLSQAMATLSVHRSWRRRG